MKICCRCHETKSLDKFYNSVSRKDGKQTICKQCQNLHITNYNKTHRKQLQSYYKKLHESRKGLPTKIVLFRRAHPIKDSNLTVENLIAKFGSNPVCYLTGVPIDLNDHNSYELDHIIPLTRGGTSSLQNCGLTSKIANRSKINLTAEEFYSLCRQVSDYQRIKVS